MASFSFLAGKTGNRSLAPLVAVASSQNSTLHEDAMPAWLCGVPGRVSSCAQASGREQLAVLGVSRSAGTLSHLPVDADAWAGVGRRRPREDYAVSAAHAPRALQARTRDGCTPPLLMAVSRAPHAGRRSLLPLLVLPALTLLTAPGV